MHAEPSLFQQSVASLRATVSACVRPIGKSAIFLIRACRWRLSGKAPVPHYRIAPGKVSPVDNLPVKICHVRRPPGWGGFWEDFLCGRRYFNKGKHINSVTVSPRADFSWWQFIVTPAGRAIRRWPGIHQFLLAMSATAAVPVMGACLSVLELMVVINHGG